MIEPRNENPRQGELPLGGEQEQAARDEAKGTELPRPGADGLKDSSVLLVAGTDAEVKSDRLKGLALVLRDVHKNATSETYKWVCKHDRDATIARIKRALTERSDARWSVTGGKGSVYGWLRINVPPSRRTYDHRPTSARQPDGVPVYELVEVGWNGQLMGPEDRALLAQLLGYEDAESIPLEGVSIPAAHDFYAEFIDRAEGRKPSARGTRYWD